MRQPMFMLLLCACASAGSEQSDAGGVKPPPDAHVVDASPPDAMATYRLVVTTAGPGSVSVSPGGAPCGPGCYGYFAPTSVTITPHPNTGLSVWSWVGGGCTTGAQGPCAVSLPSAGETDVSVSFCPWEWVVDPAGGSDGSQGICVSPFKTVTKAMTRATAGQSVHLFAGTANAATGETFPINVPAGVTLVGDESVKGLGIGPMKIDGGAADTLMLGADAVVAGLWIQGHWCLQPSGDRMIVRNNTISTCSEGIRDSGKQSLQILGNNFTANGSGVVYVGVSPAWTGKAENNVLSGGGIGVEFDVPGTDFGGGPGGSAGGNTFCGNSQADVWTDLGSTSSVWVQANKWDHVPPTTFNMNVSGQGWDIISTSTATLEIDGATAVTACP